MSWQKEEIRVRKLLEKVFSMIMKRKLSCTQCLKHSPKSI
jgi:hypothetical protein